MKVPSRVAAVMVAVAVCVAVPGVVSGRTASGGGSIASATNVVPGQQEFGNTGDGQYSISCNGQGSFWKVSLIAGDHLTVDWEAQNDAAHYLDFWPVGTTDFSMNNAQPKQTFEIGGNGKAESLFIPDKTGVYPMMFDTCGQTGPFDFTTTLKHQVVLLVPKVASLPLHGAVIAVGTHTPDGTPITGAALGLTLSGFWSGAWHVISSAHPAAGVAKLKVKLPAVVKGTRIKILIGVGGASYLPARVIRSVRVG